MYADRSSSLTGRYCVCFLFLLEDLKALRYKVPSCTMIIFLQIFSWFSHEVTPPWLMMLSGVILPGLVMISDDYDFGDFKLQSLCDETGLLGCAGPCRAKVDAPLLGLSDTK